MAATAIQLFDETPGGARTPAFRLTLASERVTAREVLRRRIEAEVAAHARDHALPFRGLVRPDPAQRALNGERARPTRAPDVAEELAHAVEAFGRNGFLMLAGDRQIDDLDAEIVVTPDLEIAFVRLVPLVGG
jgi:hypothetical protein